MGEHKILITTSGTGSRLGSITDYTNKSLVRVGDKPIISHILDYYGKSHEFIITVGHHGDKVKQYISIAHKHWQIQFVDIDKYEGPGSSLGYSISLCEQFLNCPFIFHACDTIIKTPSIEVDKNWILGACKKDSSHYRTILSDADKVLSIKEKGEIDIKCCYAGVAGIRDYKVFFESLGLHLKTNSNTSDADAINLMLPKCGFQLKEISEEDWLDIGNATSLNETRAKYKTSADVLEKKDEEIYFYEDLVIKFFNNKKISENRVKRGKNLKNITPEIIESTSNFYSYKKVQGNLFSKSANSKSFKKFLNWSKDNLWIPLEDNDEEFYNSCKNFYIDKTLLRTKLYLDGQADKETIINGKSVPSVHELLDKIDKNWISKGRPVQFHGDFILDNVIETKNGFVLIDWRQDFQGDLIKGDIYYDLAKLNHNLIVNHEAVKTNMFSITEIKEDEKKCDILCHHRLMECKDVLFDFILKSGFDQKKVKVITAIIWLNMSGLHEQPFSKFLFNFGKYHLAESLEI